MWRVSVDGDSWDVVVGRESWGRLVALFVPVAAEAGIRQTVLDAAGFEDAHREIEAMGSAGREALFRRSVPRD